MCLLLVVCSVGLMMIWFVWFVLSLFSVCMKLGVFMLVVYIIRFVLVNELLL